MAEFSIPLNKIPDVTSGPRDRHAHRMRPPVVTHAITKETSSIHYEESYLLDVESGGGTGEKGSNGELHFDCIILFGILT